MAGLQRLVCLGARRNFSTAAQTRFWFGKEKETDFMPDPLEHATGLEKKQLSSKLQGVSDPFDMKAVARGHNSKDKPLVITSAIYERHIGCICDEDTTSIRWMIMKQGELKRCYCGHWFKLEKKEIYN